VRRRARTFDDDSDYDDGIWSVGLSRARAHSVLKMADPKRSQSERCDYETSEEGKRNGKGCESAEKGIERQGRKSLFPAPAREPTWRSWGPARGAPPGSAESCEGAGCAGQRAALNGQRNGQTFLVPSTD
jgi:hypothetical protein